MGSTLNVAGGTRRKHKHMIEPSNMERDQTDREELENEEGRNATTF
jgi:hypothetical protein